MNKKENNNFNQNNNNNKYKNKNNNNNKTTIAGCDTIEINLVFFSLRKSYIFILVLK